MRRLLTSAVGLLCAVCTALVGPGLAQAADSPAVGHAEPLSAPPWLGVQMAKGGEQGVGVEHVVRGSPAEKAGVRVGDRIIALDGTKVTDPAEVSRLVASRRAGENVSVSLARGGQPVTAAVTLARRPSGDDILRMDLVGAFAPAWTNVTPLSGAPASLDKMRGQVVLVDFWATWCGPCRALAPKLSTLKDRYGAQGLNVVGITTDPAEKAAVFAERNQMRYGVVVDKEGDTSRAYGISSLPTMLLIDKRGVIREVFVGFDPSGDARLEALIKSLLAEPASQAAAAGR